MRFGMTDAEIDSGWDLTGGTVPVGKYAPNIWGIYEMFGNVAELCLDADVGLGNLRKYYGALKGLSEDDCTYDRIVIDNPEGGPLKNTYPDGHAWKQYESSAESTHVMRGGSWYNTSGHFTHFKR